VGLGSGLRELVSGTPGCWKQVRLALLPGTLVGLTLGVIQLISQNVIPKDALIPALNNPNTFEWLLRCLSAALTEEIAFRFGLMSLFVWIIRAIVKRPAIHTPSLWIGNLLSVLVFAAAHFPQYEANAQKIRVFSCKKLPFKIFWISMDLDIFRWFSIFSGTLWAQSLSL
jgi:Type II CAAX prenyl endopeptidase Rce1-like